jgi:hypothetical protein
MLLMGRHRMTTEPRDAQFEGIAERTRRKTTRRLMPFLFVLYIIAYLDIRAYVTVQFLNLASEDGSETFRSERFTGHVGYT